MLLCFALKIARSLQASFWHEMEGNRTVPWAVPPDVSRQSRREQDIEKAMARTRALSRYKIMDQVVLSIKSCFTVIVRQFLQSVPGVVSFD